MKRENKKIIFENENGAVVWRFDEKSYYVYERGLKGILIESFEIPTVREGKVYLGVENGEK